jgi:hypothetical protein
MSARFLVRPGIVILVAVLLAVSGLLRANSASAQTQLAVEYYYADWNFYFVTSDPGEIAALDGGAFGGLWKRTGQTFTVWTGSSTGALPTCRFFSVIFAPRSSHFYTDRAGECATLKQNPGWQYEAIAFYLQPLTASYDCPANTVILYRLFNNGMGGAPNHRFITDVVQVAAMIAAGWSLEGDGPKIAYACVLATVIPGGTAEGFWDGKTSTNQTIDGFVLDDGTFYFLYSPPNEANIAGVVQGNASAANGQFNSSNAKDFNISGLGVTNGAIAGTYVPRTSLNGTFTSGYGTSTFSATYLPVYDQPASLAAAAGTYSGQAASSAGIQNVVVTINAAGAVSGAAVGCSFSGTATPRGSVDIFNLSVTFQGGACIFGTSTLAGIAYYDVPQHALYAAAPNASRTDGFLFVGTKP